MRTIRSMAAVLAAGLTALASAQTAAAQAAAAMISNVETRLIAGFEDQKLEGWEGTGGTTVQVSEAYATEGKCSLRADMPPGDYPGVGVDFRKFPDWSDCQAFRFSAFNAGKNSLKVCVRIDDAGSKNFATRYNNDMYPHTLNPGSNEVEVTVAALREGSMLARGLDVSRIRTIRVFVGGCKSPVTLYFDNFRVVSEKTAGAATLTVADMDSGNSARWTAAGGAEGKVEANPDGASGSALKLTLSPEGEYPRVDFSGMDRDWLSYDLLRFDLTCPRDVPTPRSMDVKIVDFAGRGQTIDLRLQKGKNTIVLPLEIGGEVGLGKVCSVSLFKDAPQVKEEVFIDNMVLCRSDLVQHPSVYGPATNDAAMTVDFTGMHVPRNTCFMALVYVPLKDGKTRAIRCNSPGKDVVKYGIPASAFADADADKPVRLWAFVSDHGGWMYWQQEARYAGQPVTVAFTVGE